MSFNDLLDNDVETLREDVDRNSVKLENEERIKAMSRHLEEGQNNNGFNSSSFYSTARKSAIFNNLNEQKICEEEGRFKAQRYQNSNQIAQYGRQTLEFDRQLDEERSNFQMIERKQQMDEEYRRSLRRQRNFNELSDFKAKMAEDLLVEKSLQNQQLAQLKNRLATERMQRKSEEEARDAARAVALNNTSILANGFAAMNLSSIMAEDTKQQILMETAKDHDQRLIEKRDEEIKIAQVNNANFLEMRRANIELDEKERFNEDASARARRQNFIIDRQSAAENMLGARKLYQVQEETHLMTLANIEKEKILFEQKEKRKVIDRLNEVAEKITGGEECEFSNLSMIQGIEQGYEVKKVTKGKALICLILDESGSMNQNVVLTGLNNFINDQKRNCPANAEMMIMKFNTTVKLMLGVQKIKSINTFTTNDYHPGGCTALYDAIISGIATAEKEISDSDQLICVIMTDGQDNASRHTMNDVKNLVQSKRGNRLYVYIGDQPELWVKNLGIQAKYAVKFDEQNPLNNFKFMNTLLKQVLQQIIQLGFKLLMDL